MRSFVAIGCVIIAAAALACGGGGDEAFVRGPTVDPSITPAALTVTTTSFEEGEELPEKHTCYGTEDGGGVSPAVSWTEGPEGTQSYVLLMREIDSPVGDIFHWAIANLPPSVTSLDEGAGGRLAVRGGRHVENSFAVPGYVGPCPGVAPREKDLRIEIFALSSKLELAVPRNDPNGGHIVLEMERHILAQGSLPITYDR